MELVLPNNYVSLEQEEMMYLDGGNWARDIALVAVTSVVSQIVGKAVSKSLVGGLINMAGAYLANAFNALVVSIMINPTPWAVAAGLAGTAAIAWGVYTVGKKYGYWK